MVIFVVKVVTQILQIEHIGKNRLHCTRGPSALETPINDPKKTKHIIIGIIGMKTKIEVDESRQS